MVQKSLNCLKQVITLIQSLGDPLQDLRPSPAAGDRTFEPLPPRLLGAFFCPRCEDLAMFVPICAHPSPALPRTR